MGRQTARRRAATSGACYRCVVKAGGGAARPCSAEFGGSRAGKAASESLVANCVSGAASLGQLGSDVVM